VTPVEDAVEDLAQSVRRVSCAVNFEKRHSTLLNPLLDSKELDIHVPDAAPRTTVVRDHDRACIIFASGGGASEVQAQVRKNLAKVFDLFPGITAGHCLRLSRRQRSGALGACLSKDCQRDDNASDGSMLTDGEEAAI
jgi:hypothetical protein